jgi:hypothetical protein
VLLLALWEAMISERRIDAGRSRGKWTCRGVLKLPADHAGQRGAVPCRDGSAGGNASFDAGCHELSMRRGTGPWQGHRVWMEIRVPTPHRGQSLGVPARSIAW